MDGITKQFCKVCNIEKLRIQVGFFGSTQRRCKRFVDETGLLWNGSTCPACHKEHCKNHIKEKRNKNKQLAITASDFGDDDAQ